MEDFLGVVHGMHATHTRALEAQATHVLNQHTPKAVHHLGCMSSTYPKIIANALKPVPDALHETAQSARFLLSLPGRMQLLLLHVVDVIRSWCAGINQIGLWVTAALHTSIKV